jgi:hypothetical protein
MKTRHTRIEYYNLHYNDISIEILKYHPVSLKLLFIMNREREN